MKMLLYSVFVSLLLLNFSSTAQGQCMILQANVSPVVCHGDQNGAIDVTVVGGMPPYTYSWSSGEDTEDLTGISAGLYILSVTDAMGCYATLSRSLSNPPELRDSLGGLCDAINSPLNLTCYTSGGIAPYQYQWSTGAGTQVISVNTAPAPYSVTITDQNGCTLTDNIVIGRPIAQVLFNNMNWLCINPIFQLDATPSQLTPNTIISWDAASGDLEHLIAGVNTLTPTINGPGFFYLDLYDPTTQCASTNNVFVMSSGPNGYFEADAGDDQTLTCINPVAQLGGTQNPVGPQFIYQWSTTDGVILSGANTTQVSVGAAGVYTLLVTNTFNGCTATDEVQVSGPDTFIVSAVPDLGLPCGGGNVTLGIVSPSGPSYVYLWMGAGINGANQLLLNPIVNTAGTYTVVMTNTLTGCTATDEVRVFHGPIIDPQQFAVVPLTCQLNELGSIDLTVNFGTAPHTFLWSNGATTEDIDQLLPGQYAVTVTDATDCHFYADLSVGQGVSATLLTLTPSPPSCPDGTNAVINLDANTPFLPLTFHWSGPANFMSTQEDPGGLSPGQYTVTVTDQTGCTATAGATVTNPPDPFSLTAVVSPAYCETNGGINLTVAGNSAPYLFDWSNDGPEDPDNDPEDLNNLIAGTYTVTVSDVNGCSETYQTTITQPNPLMALSAIVTNALCTGDGGMIDLSVTGGNAPYTYIWSTGNTTQDLANAPAGTYTVTVADVRGCTQTLSATIGVISSITLNMTHTPPLCFGGNDGSINLEAANGQAPYSYDWSNDGPETPDNDPEDLSGLSAGVYTVTVTDVSGCVQIQSVTVDQPSAVSLNAQAANASCSNGNDGSIDLSAGGGTPGYSFQWSDNSTAEDPFGLAPGIYTVTATDAAGCSATLATPVLQSEQIPASQFSVTPVSCPINAADGAINLNSLPPAAQAPILYQWAGPNGYSSTQVALTDLAPGIYQLTLTDAGACPYYAALTVDKLLSGINLSVTVAPVACAGGNQGAIDLSVNSTNGPFVFQWSNNSTWEDINGLTAGVYTVTVSDIDACSSVLTVVVDQPAPLQLTFDVTAARCHDESSGAIDLSVAGGTPPYQFLWTNGATEEDQNNLAVGAYGVTLTDAKGCIQSEFAVVTEPPAISIPNNQIVITNIRCFGSTDGAIDIEVVGGTPPYTYDWSFDGTEDPDNDLQDLSNQQAGIYEVTVSDAKGCSVVSQALTITQPPPLEVQILELSNSCAAAILQATVSGGAPAYNYFWSSSIGVTSTTSTLTVPTDGTYYLTVTDNNGCSISTSATVQLAGSGACGFLGGLVIHDLQDNCQRESGEPGLSGWIVRAQGADTLYGVTDQQGKYLIAVPAGSYTVAVVAQNNLWEVCPVGFNVWVNGTNDTVAGGDFPVKSLYDCPLLEVSIGTNQLRRCFSNNYYHVKYCNNGTVAEPNAYVVVTLDPFLNFMGASKPHQALGNNRFRFNIGYLDVGQCGTFNIQVTVSCTSILGQTHCSEVRIYPDTLCNLNQLWSGASVDLRSDCQADSLRFVVKNIGSGPINSALNYIVVEDAVMRMTAPVPPMPAGDSILISFPANGSTWRMEVEQEAYHPYPQPVSLSIEGCTTNSTFSTGFVNKFPLGDAPPYVDEDCTANIGSFDPNDKHSYPIGYGAEHYIRPNTEIEYLIRFQNTGTDTAFRVVILDTLSAHLDPSSIRFGASSHPYRYDLTGPGIVHFIFEDIMLPDSFVNEPASHGFVKFSILPRAETPLETDIYNMAAIYFDFNDPIITNITRQRLGEDFILVRSWQPRLMTARVEVIPNPFSESAWVTVSGLQQSGQLTMEIMDLQGRCIQNLETENNQFELRQGPLKPGVYWFGIRQRGRLVGSGKLVVQ